MTEVIVLDGVIINIGEWDYMAREVEVVGNPYLESEVAPEGWDFQITTEVHIDNPLPEGATKGLHEIFLDNSGTYWLASRKPEVTSLDQLAKDKAELAELLVDIQLGLATPAEVARAVELRTSIKSV